jgi:hypothetical protein
MLNAICVEFFVCPSMLVRCKYVTFFMYQPLNAVTVYCGFLTYKLGALQVCYIVHFKSHCALKKGIGSDVHKRLYRPEPI